jgi:hypothetical protein
MYMWGWRWKTDKKEEKSSPICSLLVNLFSPCARAWAMMMTEGRRIVVTYLFSPCVRRGAWMHSERSKHYGKNTLLYLSPRVPTTFASRIRSTTRKARHQHVVGLSLSFFLSFRCLSPSMGKRFFRRRGRRRFLQQAAATLVQGPVSSSSRRAERDTRGAWRGTDGTNGKAHSGIQWTKVHERFKADHDMYASYTLV